MIDSNRIEMNCRVIEEFRANNGKVQGWGPLILAHNQRSKNRSNPYLPINVCS